MRRGLGRGRTLIAIGAILAIVSMPLAWRSAGGIVLPVSTEWGFAGTSFLLFLASVLMLGLIVLPFTSKARRSGLDRPVSYVVLAVVGAAGLVMAVTDLLGGEERYRLGPTDAPGLWLAAAAVALIVWGVLEFLAERPAAP